MIKGTLVIGVCVAAALAGCGGNSNSSSSAPSNVTQGPDGSTVVSGPGPDVTIPAGPPPKKLIVEDIKVGHGPKAKLNDTLAVRQVAVRYVTGELFESNWKKGDRLFSFDLNTEDVSPGWVKGLQGMRVGGLRKLIVPTALTSRFDVPPGTGPEATLVYLIELVKLGNLRKHGEPVLVSPGGAAPSNLVVKDIIRGKGPPAGPGDELTVEYMAIQYDGSPFSNSWTRRKPFRFRLGAGDFLITPGWEKGIPGMRVGGRRELIVPPDLLQRGGPPPGGESARQAMIWVVDLIELTS